MLWLYIISALAVIIALMLLVPVGVRLEFSEGLSCVLRVWFVKLKLYPAPPKKKKPKKKPKKKSSEKLGEKKTDIFFAKGLSGLIDILTRLAKLAKGVLKDFFKRIIIKEFTLDIRVAGDNAADTAISYGRYCAVVYPLVSALIGAADRCKSCVVEVYPDFNEKAETEAYFAADVRIRPIHLISLVLRHGFKALKILGSLSSPSD